MQEKSDFSKGLVIWLTGLAGSGKSYIAEALYKKLCLKYKNIIYLDGDELRDLLGNYDYDKQGRINMALKRSQFAHFLSSQEMIVIVSTISMFKEIYDYNRKTLKNYCEIYIQCELEELIKRDKKNLYTKAINKEINNVVGIDLKYDEPKPDLIIDNNQFGNLEQKVENILNFLKI
ncbi:adenylyl-sulfate kinase [Campylobacter sp. TTU_617]|uniref:adenylyl-sulfate kinase n=1 Tax=Campylobacter sp. TTU_617 TaxID=2768148 RepID=UPI0019037BAB|nr:adenylyl-sulfate kinase [Campylobacter sp. TTU_617]MBK1971587.1 adenylyl-sulfate kinase [Campylobacter sp. TTU_617]